MFVVLARRLSAALEPPECDAAKLRALTASPLGGLTSQCTRRPASRSLM
jgi:hypothetical protein